MGIDFGGFKVGMSEQFLNAPRIDPAFHEVGGEAVSQGVNTADFWDSGSFSAMFEYFLDCAAA